MIAHASIAVGDYDKAKEFYSKALAPLGYTLTKEYPEYKVAGFFDGTNTDFWINTVDSVQKGHIAFTAKNADEVKAFYDAALAAGGKDNGGPGYRKDYGAGYYAAFVYDADGNNIEAMWWDAAAK